jgi:hypothetical protein
LELLSRTSFYREAHASDLVGHYHRVLVAVDVLTKKVEEFPHTPHTAETATALEVTARSLVVLGTELRNWHAFLHPERE